LCGPAHVLFLLLDGPPFLFFCRPTKEGQIPKPLQNDLRFFPFQAFFPSIFFIVGGDYNGLIGSLMPDILPFFFFPSFFLLSSFFPWTAWWGRGNLSGDCIAFAWGNAFFFFDRLLSSARGKERQVLGFPNRGLWGPPFF